MKQLNQSQLNTQPMLVTTKVTLSPYLKCSFIFRRQFGQHRLPRVEREPGRDNGAVQDRAAADVGGRAGVAAGAAGAGGVHVDDRLARGPQPGGGGVRAEGLPQGKHCTHSLV